MRLLFKVTPLWGHLPSAFADILNTDDVVHHEISFKERGRDKREREKQY